MKKILVVEDEERMARLVRDYLVKYGYIVVQSKDGIDALEVFAKEQPDLVILDWMIPGIDGVEVCHEIKSNSTTTPVLMLTAKSEEEDELEGLKFGADDYMKKPFSPKILMARIEALLRYTEKFQEKTIKNGLVIDSEKHIVYLDKNELKLTPKEFELVLYMSKNSNLTLSRDQILNSVWGYDYEGDPRTVDTHIKRLRKKLDGRFIDTIRGYGYKFEVK